MRAPYAITGGQIFDGTQFQTGQALLVREGKIEARIQQGALPADIALVDASGAFVVPGFVDLQVNGGGGVLLNNDTSLGAIRRICAAHARFGTTALLPTLITDRPDILPEALQAGCEALKAQVPGYLGLHLEGPHLSLARKGTHDPALIRRMTEEDLAFLLDQAGQFGYALTTIAPESVTTAQVRALSEAGYVVSLGHTDERFETFRDYVAAGASIVTHLFNAMSQLTNREPGLVGAGLFLPELSCGLIADGFHVDPACMTLALRAKRGPGRIFLVTDSMSTIGVDDESFELNGRMVYRRNGRLTLADGTLAGADIDMLACLRFVTEKLGVPLPEALNMASLHPAEAIGAASKGALLPGKDADFLFLTPKLELTATWIGGRCVYEAKRS
ncbi:N-acetylglucosamine-6-phosphate deacetylase [Rhizobium paknamense]|uniref:N-acetylglucosamine-6-phosphate deacetylase n=1 Tax=Rhizobium paknamense TaxID=1206817 RepID=UPI00352301A0